MAFPTIPTAGAGRVLGNNQADTTATRTFPNLSSLTKNSGDLLIAIIVAYQTGTGTNAAFSGWSAGWTEFHDSATSTTLAIGMAYKWSTGSETGTITVTQAGTITGHASMILLSIPGAHATTPPEAGSRASGTGASNPASFNPSGWDVADTLWIAVGGSGEDAITGSWTGMGSAPTNYSSYFDTATTDTSTVGQTEAAVAFRQLAAASEDVAAFTSNDTSNARDAAVVIAVRNAPVTLFGITALPITFGAVISGIAIPAPKTTPVAEISLASHGTPTERTNHTIKIRARTTSGSTGVIKAALYEGSTNRSGDLTSAALTTSLADYTLVIPDASAANITDYSNLSLRIWGYDSTGAALVFEVANVYLQLPVSSGGPTTYYGATALPMTFGSTTAGQRKTFTSTAFPITFTKAVAGQRKAFGATAFPITFTKAVAGQRKTFSSTAFPIAFGSTTAGFRPANTYFGVTSLPITFGSTTAGFRPSITLFGVAALPITFSKAVSGQRKTFSSTAFPITFTKVVAGQRKTFGQLLSPYIFGKVVAGQRKAFGQTALPITFASTTAGFRVGVTYFGIVARPITFAKDVNGVRKTFSSTAFPITFSKAVSGQRKTFGQIVFPITFTKAAAGVEIVYGSLSMGTIFGKEVAGRRKTFSQSAFPITFGKDVRGVRKAFGAVSFPITMPIYVIGVTQGNVYGATSFAITFVKDVSARRKTFGQLLSPYIFSATTQGRRRTSSQVAMPIIFSKAVSGQRKTFGIVARPINATIFVAGYGWVSSLTYFGQVAMPLTFNKQVSGKLKAFSRIAFPTALIIDVKTGRIATHGRIAFPITITFYADSRIIEPGIVLNLAENVHLGTQPVVAVYADGQLVWPPT